MMTEGVIAAAATLCEVLAQENAALSALDVPRANLLLAAKTAATEALMRQLKTSALPPTPENLAQAERLRALAQQNKLLLERAMLAQNRVMACIARAVPKAISQGGRYGARGRLPTSSLTPPMAFSARA